jgi:hypothetical protein
VGLIGIWPGRPERGAPGAHYYYSDGGLWASLCCAETAVDPWYRPGDPEGVLCDGCLGLYVADQVGAMRLGFEESVTLGR